MGPNFVEKKRRSLDSLERLESSCFDSQCRGRKHPPQPFRLDASWSGKSSQEHSPCQVRSSWQHGRGSPQRPYTFDSIPVTLVSRGYWPHSSPS